MKIIICGGHHNSALVVAEKLKEKGNEIFWFGHKYSMLGDKNPSAEFLEVTQKGFPFVEIQAGKWQPSSRFCQNLLRIPVGFWQSYRELSRIKPDLVFSFGGYLALPVAYMAFLLGIPVVTHEQTTVAGWANRMIGVVAKKIFLTFESSGSFYPKDKVVLTGLPLRPEIFKSGKKLFRNKKKTIYITGGKQGSHAINEAVFKILPQLLERFNLIHQVGSTTLFNDIEKAREIKIGLGESGRNYLPKEYFFGEEIGSVFNSADFVVSRAGAHIVYELSALGKPAILIPLPNSSCQEQEKNAQMLKDLGLAEILPQSEVEKGELKNMIGKVAEDLKKYQPAREMKTPPDSAELMAGEIQKLL